MKTPMLTNIVTGILALMTLLILGNPTIGKCQQVILEGSDSAFIHMQNGIGSSTNDLLNSLDLTTTSNSYQDKWSWRHKATISSLTLAHIRQFTAHNLYYPFLHFSSNGNVGFGTDTPGAKFDFVRDVINPILDIGTKGLPGLFFQSGVYAGIGTNNSDTLAFGVQDHLDLIMTQSDILANNDIKTTGKLVSNYGPTAQFEEWSLYSQNQLFTSTLNFSNNFHGLVAYIDNVGDYVEISDRRSKKNILALGRTIEKLYLLNPKSYRYKNQEEDAAQSLGLIAQEIKSIFPDVVSYDDTLDQFGIKYRAVSVLAIKAFQELEEEIENIAEQLSRLEELTSQLKN